MNALAHTHIHVGHVNWGFPGWCVCVSLLCIKWGYCVCVYVQWDTGTTIHKPTVETHQPWIFPVDLHTQPGISPVDLTHQPWLSPIDHQNKK